MLFYICVAFVVMVDQVSKGIVRLHMHVGETLPFWHNHVHFMYYENSGAAFSSFQGFGRYFVIVALALVVGVLYYRRKGKLRGVFIELGTGFLVGGAIGNAIDRTLFNKVTDFLMFGQSGGILNLADIAINIGMFFIMIHTLAGLRKTRNPFTKCAKV
jgi:signal peptidase II